MKELGKDNKEWVDGSPVELYDGKFTGTFGMEDADACGIAADDEVFFIVSAKAAIPSFSAAKKIKGLKRTNVFKVGDVKVVESDELEFILDQLERGNNGD